MKGRYLFLAMTSVIDFRGCFDSQDGVFLRSREVHSVQTQVLPGDGGGGTRDTVETLHAAGRLRESLGWPLPTDPATNHQLALSESSICEVKAATKIEWQLQGAPTA